MVQYDVLQHVQWISYMYPEKFEPSWRGKISSRALAVLDRSGMVRNVVITGGYMWGKSYPSQADVHADYLVQQYHIQRDRIHVVPEAYTTQGETRTFIKVAEAEKWNQDDLVSLCFRPHNWSVNQTWNNMGRRAKIINVEDVLKNNVDLQNLLHSRYEINFKMYELVKRLALLFSPDYKLLEKYANRRNKPAPIAVSRTFGKLVIDKYNLPPVKN